MELCLLTIRIEVAFNVDAGSFILALRRLICRLGNIRLSYSSNRSNFIRAERKLKDDNKIQSFMENIGGDWIKWNKSLPLVSCHMGGVWEKQICSARAILASMLKTYGKSLKDVSLLTLMAEVEGILNSQPLTGEAINDPGSFQPLSLANILWMKHRVVMPLPGNWFVFYKTLEAGTAHSQRALVSLKEGISQAEPYESASWWRASQNSQQPERPVFQKILSCTLSYSDVVNKFLIEVTFF